MSLFGRLEHNRHWESLFAEQVRLNGRTFFRVANRVIRNSAAAEDAVQEAMTRCWALRTELKDVSRMGGWLTQAVVNESLQVRRSGGIRQRAVERKAAGASSFVVPQDDFPDEVRQRISQALEQLPEELRCVVVLRILEEMKGRQVAELLGCSEGEVSKKLTEAMKELRRLLPEWNVQGPGAKRESDVV